jgi:hypothetical protein
MSALPPKADNKRAGGRLIARRADLLSNYLSQRFINPVLPTRPGVLKVIKNVPSIRKETSSLAFGIVGCFGGSSAGFVVAALNAASATSREVVVLPVLSADILCPLAKASLS